MARLTDAGFKVAFTPPKREKGERTSILRRREERFAKTFSGAAERMLASPDYQVAPDRAKSAAINDLAKHLREWTRKEIAEKTFE